MANKEPTAREKYLYNEIKKLRKENASMAEYVYALEKENNEHKKAIELLDQEGLILRAMVNKLLEGKDLTEETVRKYIEEDIKHTNALEMLLAISKEGGKFI